MMVAKRSPEKQDVMPSKKLKVADDNDNGVIRNKSELEKSKSKKKNESILINPELEVKVEVDQIRREQLNSSANLVRVFASECFTLRSPNVISYTHCGQVPHITADLCSSEVNGDFSIVPLHSIFNSVKVLGKLGKTLSQFVNTKNKIILNPFDSSEPCDLTSFNDQMSMSVWGKGGNKKVTSKDYIEIIKVCQPEMFVSLSDVVPSTVSKKRANKSCYRTLRWVTEAITHLSDSNEMTSRLLAPIPGSGDRQLMMKSAYLLATRQVFGYVIERATLPREGWEDLVKDIISILPPSRPVFMLGVLNELEMVQAYNCGCHFVDSSFALQYSNKGQAMALNTLKPSKLPDPSQLDNLTSEKPSEDFGPSLAENVPQQISDESDNKKKKGKETQNGRNLIFKAEDYMPTKSLTLDLKSPIYTRQFYKMVEDCQCFSCTRHTRGYINHLLITRELLAPTLLMLHNVYHVRNVVNVVKMKVNEGVLAEYKKELQEVFSLD